MSDEPTTPFERARQALSTHPLYGCGCCTWPDRYEEEHPDDCPSGDGYTDHTYEGSCWKQRGYAEILTAAVLDSALSVEELALTISKHRHGSDVVWPEDRRLAQAVRDAVVGGAA